MPRTPANEADWIKSEIEETDHKLRDDSQTGCSYAWAYGRLSVIAKHAEAVIRRTDPAYGLSRPTHDQATHDHHLRREPPRDGLHK